MNTTTNLRGTLAPLRVAVRRARAILAAAARALERRRAAPTGAAILPTPTSFPNDAHGGRSGRPPAVAVRARRPVPDEVITRRARDHAGARPVPARPARLETNGAAMPRKVPARRRRATVPAAGLRGQLALFPAPDDGQAPLFPWPDVDGPDAGELAAGAGGRTAAARCRPRRWPYWGYDSPDRASRPPRSGVSTRAGEPDTPERGGTHRGTPWREALGHRAMAMYIRQAHARHTHKTRDGEDRAMAQQTKTTKNPNAATVRHIRVDDELWLPAVEKAASQGAGASEMVRALLRAYNAGRVEL